MSPIANRASPIKLSLLLVAFVLTTAASAFDGDYVGLAKTTKSSCPSQTKARMSITNTQQFTYSDGQNGRMSGTLGDLGSVKATSGSVTLSGIVRGDEFLGKVVGGACPFDVDLIRQK